MYKIIGANKLEYGPVGIDQLRQWYHEGRVDADTLIQPAGGADWKPLRAIPELASALGIAAGQTPPPIPPSGTPPPFTPPPMAGKPQPDGPNWMAVTGLILGALSLFCCFNRLLSLLGLIFSCVGLVQANNRPGRSSDLGIAIAGIVLSAIGLLFRFALGVLFFNLLRNLHP